MGLQRDVTELHRKGVENDKVAGGGIVFANVPAGLY